MLKGYICQYWERYNTFCWQDSTILTSNCLYLHCRPSRKVEKYLFRNYILARGKGSITNFSFQDKKLTKTKKSYQG